jgi:hypothetical protein
VTRYQYNQQIIPPAPFVHVTLARPDGSVTLSDIPAQLDTAADFTVFARPAGGAIGIGPIGFGRGPGFWRCNGNGAYVSRPDHDSGSFRPVHPIRIRPTSFA